MALGAVLLGIGGGTVANILAGSGPSVFSVEWIDDPGRRRLLTSFDPWPGGIGLLGLGPVVVAGVAAVLAWRDRLVLVLVTGVAALVLARLVLRYEPFPGDIVRLDGHARNLALLALLLALGARLGRPAARPLAVHRRRPAHGPGYLADGRGTSPQPRPGHRAGS